MEDVVEGIAPAV
eukprot:SM002210S06954  [mRNA]  locus=s2210:1020:1058:+ [translate_table: standard]